MAIAAPPGRVRSRGTRINLRGNLSSQPFLKQVQVNSRLPRRDATGLAILLLLALGTFVAGVHILAWQVCTLGLVMALCVPAIAWIEESTLILLLGAIVLIGVGMTFCWSGSGRDAIG